MKAVCPKDKSHKKFITIVNVIEEWLVDSEGTCLVSRVLGNDGPDPGNVWACSECGAQAKVTCD